MFALLLATTCLMPMLRDGQDNALSGPELTVAAHGEQFLVHYTLEGSDAVSPEDDDGDGLPDTVSQVIAGLELGATSFEADGWRTLVGDEGAGDTDAIDVYLREIDANGYAYPIPGEEGYACYMEIDSGLGSAGRITESVALHELHHCIQYRYRPTGMAFLYEASATWAQYFYVMDPALEYALGVLYAARLAEPDLPMNDTDGRYEYAGFLVMKFWREYAAEANDRLPELWEIYSWAEDWIEALEVHADNAWNLDLDEALLEYATWNAFACARDDGGHYDPNNLPCIADAEVLWAEIDDTVSIKHSDTPFTTSYHQIFADGDDRSIRVRCDVTKGKAVARLVAFDGQGVRGEHADGLDLEEEVRLLQAVDPDGGAWLMTVSMGESKAAKLDCKVDRVRALEGPDGEPLGCGCTSGAGPQGLLPILLLVAALLPRRQRRQHHVAV
jgi:MYXO-CTERM domain-containing protein